MPALPNVSKVVRIEYHMTDGGDLNVMNSFHLQYSGSLSDADAATWVAACKAAWGTAGAIADSIVNTVTLVKTVLTDLTSNSSPQKVDTATSPGNSGGTLTPGSTCLVVSRRIVRRYRGGHSRVYTTGHPVSGLGTPPQWAAGYASAVATLWAQTEVNCVNGAPGGVGAVTPVNVSYFQGFTNHTFPSGRIRPIPTLRATPVVDVVTQYTGNPNIASQRRRNLQSK